jgi:hypothetical protein
VSGHDPYKPSIEFDGMSINVTPQQVAKAFWLMSDSDQADFYEALGEVSRGRLCLQAAYLLTELRRRRRLPDSSCCDGLDTYQTLHNHADQLECFIDDDVDEAKRCIAGMVARAKRSFA